MIYELINPSDEVHFSAPDDEVAFAAALFVGRGKYTARAPGGTEVGALLLFAGEDKCKAATARLDAVIAGSRDAVIAALRSFSYGPASAAALHMAAMAAITDDVRRAEYQRRHDDENRSSINQIVNRANSLADAMAQATDTKGGA